MEAAGDVDVLLLDKTGTITLGNRQAVDFIAMPESAILSAVIFNALIIVALIPLALRGVPYRPVAVALLLRDNLLVYGLGGLVAPFIGIKLIDLILTAVGLA
jgi:K+-transporting ATPase ATPase B chain